jgi:pantothenate synthetase
MPHRIYRGTKVYFIRSPHLWGSSLWHASPLGYFDRVIFFLIASLQLVEENQAYLGHRANRQVEIDERLVKDHFRGVGVPEISVNPP